MANINNWERRWHPLLQEWVILAATTSDRPWSGETVKAAGLSNPDLDPTCYLCPGVKRASGEINPNYTKPFAFTNDFASFSMDAPDVHVKNGFEISAPVHGTCRVLCFSSKHNTTMAQMSEEEIRDIYQLWLNEFSTLSSHPKISNVLMFENKGEVIGVSNHHPHGQIYATGFIPKIVKRERDSFVEYKRKKGTNLLIDLINSELEYKKRIILENDSCVAFIPYFARFVYETYIIPKRHVSRITDLTEKEIDDMAFIHKKVITKFDNLYKMSFPNITMLHNAPTNDDPENAEFHFHIEFYPPMRSSNKLKYLAGFESGGGNIINPVLPETSAENMRKASDVHFLLES